MPVKCHKTITFVSYALLSSIPLLSSASKEDIPPCLPEVLRWCGLFNGRRCLRWRLPAADDDDGVFSGSHVAQSLARLSFDDCRVPVMTGLLREGIVIGLGLLCLRLSSAELLHQLAIGPCLRQRA